MKNNSPEKVYKNGKSKAAVLLDLFLLTFKIGAVTFGGGYVIIALLKKEFSDKRGYIKEEEILDILAVSQSLPGVISINACIMAGYRSAGVAGALCAAVGVVLPSFITLSILTYFYQIVKENVYVAAGLYGIRACVVALMIDAVLNLSKPVLKGAIPWIVMGAAFLFSFEFNINGIIIIVAGALIGLVYKLVISPDAKEENIEETKKIEKGDDDE